MKTILVMHGAQASGKSTAAKDLLKKEPGKWKRVNRDSIRLMLDEGVWSPENEKLVVRMRDFLIREGIRAGFSVIVDDMNLAARNFKDIVKIAQSLNEDVQVLEKHYWVPLDEAIKRDGIRENSVGEKVIRDTWKKYDVRNDQHYKPKHEIFTKRTTCADAPFSPAKQNQDAPKAIIVDIDGTYALLGNRSPYDATHADEIDFPNPPVIETVRLYYNAGYKIIFCSGREDKDRKTTIRFIERHSPKMDYLLLMRQTSDNRSDDIIKEEIYRAEIDGKYNILVVIDDRKRVVSKWRELGLTCFQVAEGDF